MKPRLRNAARHKPLYPLNEFPDNFALNLGKELIYILATRDNPDVSGDDWEQIFARCIGVEWKKSNVGLEDVVCGQTAWSAKTIKNAHPFTHEHVRLITGRNSVDYSFDVANVHDEDPNKIGTMVLEIWNARHEKETELFSDLRTAVLIRDGKMQNFSVAEIASRPFDPKQYKWDWNEGKNLEGYEIATDRHWFTWQTHGAQFTVLPRMPDKRLKIRLKQPPAIGHDFVLDTIHFDPSWIEIVK